MQITLSCVASIHPWRVHVRSQAVEKNKGKYLVLLCKYWQVNIKDVINHLCDRGDYLGVFTLMILHTTVEVGFSLI